MSANMNSEASVDDTQNPCVCTPIIDAAIYVHPTCKMKHKICHSYHKITYMK